MLHETTWICQDTGASPAKGDGTAGKRPDHGRGVPSGRVFNRLRLPLASSPGRRWGGGVGVQTGSRPAAEAPEGRMSAAAGRVVERGLGLWLPQRTVDSEAHRPGDPPGVWGPLSPQPCLAGVTAVALVLPSARTPARAAGRGSRGTLEAIQVAAYKKRRENLGPIWPSLMKAAFCSFPRAGGRGGRKLILPRFPTATSTTASRPWRCSRSVRCASASGCTLTFSRTTSKPRMSPRSCASFCVTCSDRSSCCGTKARYTRGLSSSESCGTTPACRLNGSPSTPRNSTRPNKSGTSSRVTRPTVCRWTNKISETVFMPTNGGSAAPRTSCDLSFWNRSCRHLWDIVYLHYFCETQ